MDSDVLSALDSEKSPRASLSFDAQKYMHHADGLDLTDAQKIEFLRTLWTIMSAFVDLGFGVDSVLPILAQRALDKGADAVQEIIPTHEFNVAVDDGAEQKED